MRQRSGTVDGYAARVGRDETEAAPVVLVELRGARWYAVARMSDGASLDRVIGACRRAGVHVEAVSERLAVRMGAVEPARPVCDNCGEVRPDVRRYEGEAWCRSCAEEGVRYAHAHVHDAERAEGCEACAAGFAAIAAQWGGR